MKIIDKYEDVDELLWEELLNSSENGSLFQTKDFYEFLKTCSYYEPFVFIGNNNGRYDFLLTGRIQFESMKLIRTLSRRAIVNGGIVTRKEGFKSDDLVEFLGYAIENLRNRAIYLEIRNLYNYSDMIPAFASAGFTYMPHLNFHVSISNETNIKKQLSESKRRQINKSLKTGASINHNPTGEQVKEFYFILKHTYKRKIHRPLPDTDFFMRFYRSGLGVYLLIMLDSRVIGGIMCPVYKDKVIYEWYIAGEDHKYSGIYPSVLATWAAIEYALNNHIKTFDFMGAGSPSDHYGVREFKSKFGGQEVEYGRFLKVFNKPVYNAGKLFFKMIEIIR
jgi:serine/alanine adding enzyme